MVFLLFETFPHKYSIIRLVFLLGKGEEGKTNKNQKNRKGTRKGMGANPGCTACLKDGRAGRSETLQ